MKKYIIVIVSLLVALAIVGGYFFPRVKGSFGAVSSNGTLNQVTSWSSVTLNTLTSSSTSVLNTGASDRAIMGSYTFCSSGTSVYSYGVYAGLANFIVEAATTSASGAVAGLQGNTNYIMYNNIATSSGIGYLASTTIGTGDFARIWPVNTYLTFLTNATTTASCTVGIEYAPI
jgi:hypothetical protein